MYDDAVGGTDNPSLKKSYVKEQLRTNREE
jgi:hypothetical protein